MNLVIYKSYTKIADDYRKDNGTTKTRNLVLAAAPDSFSLSTKQKAIICAGGYAAANALGGAAACAASFYLPSLVLNWFKSDVRNRSDFGGERVKLIV
ncbi:MAG TPA: hypothetical protein VFN21_10055 [Acidimicrobiales bacterium]|nr:hypothetical protein [Acidimicrobiales bacterium]